eukprot:CCRYP_001169-RC/>CCRYP_001169-RC protein AED:0.49 eAED:1.00 QI:0/-1/0/1/-1/0/1/0/22
MENLTPRTPGTRAYSTTNTYTL